MAKPVFFFSRSIPERGFAALGLALRSNAQEANSIGHHAVSIADSREILAALVYARIRTFPLTKLLRLPAGRIDVSPNALLPVRARLEAPSLPRPGCRGIGLPFGSWPRPHDREFFPAGCSSERSGVYGSGVSGMCVVRVVRVVRGNQAPAHPGRLSAQF